MHQYVTNVVEIELTIDSKNKTRSFPKYKLSWADEIGRAIFLLTADVKGNNVYRTNVPLTLGIEKVNVVSELIDGCLPTGSKGTEFVFVFLLQQLSHSDDTHDYKLCRTHDDEDGFKQYNCSRITTGNLIICDDYASNLIGTFRKYISQVAYFLSLICFPFILLYLRSFSDEKEEYEILDSPLAISTIFHTFFIEGHGSAKSIVRRLFSWLVLAILSTIILPLFTAIVVSVAFLFVIVPFDVFSLNNLKHDFEYQIVNNFRSTITSPFNIKLWCKLFSSVLSRHETKRAKILSAVLSFFLFPFVFSIVILFSLSAAACAIILLLVIPHAKTEETCLRRWVKVYLSLPAAIWCMINLSAFFHFICLIMAVIYLNGVVYIPYLMPIIAIVTYSVKHWRRSIEKMYLVLKTNIYKVCKELWEENESEGRTELPTFLVDVTNHKAPKPLYNMTREAILPFDRVLFYFFVRIFWVANFVLFVIVTIFLAQESNISGPVQIISAITLSSLPFIFDTILIEDASAQNQVNIARQKKQIRSMMTLVNRTETIATVSLNVDEKDTSIQNLRQFFIAFNPLFGMFFSE